MDRVRTLIRSFRNDANPKIAVTVDLLTTGIDVPSITNLVFLRRVNSRILYEQMIGRATRLCPEIGKEVFRIFDAVDLYPHLQNLTDMKPVVVNPSISFEQLVKELIAADQDAHRETIRQQLAVKLRRILKKLPPEVRAKFEATAGETPEATLKRLLEAKPAELSKWFSSRSGIGPILDWQGDGDTAALHADLASSGCGGGRHARLWRGQEAGRLSRRLHGLRARQHQHHRRPETRGAAPARPDPRRPARSFAWRSIRRAIRKPIFAAPGPTPRTWTLPPRSSASSVRRHWAIRLLKSKGVSVLNAMKFRVECNIDCPREVSICEPGSKIAALDKGGMTWGSQRRTHNSINRPEETIY